MSRFLEKDFSGDISGEELLKKWVTSLNDSWNGSYRLHIEALKHQALADTLQVLAEQADAEELTLESPDLKTIIERRTSLLHAERQIYFNCLPNVIQHELAKTTIDEALPLAQALSAYQSAAIMLTHEKHSQIPPYTSQNPSINSPLSKPQLEGLLHLVDEQRL